MRKLISETLTMHSQTLIKAMEEYAYKTWVTNAAECGVGNAVPNFDHEEVSREGMTFVVAQILIEAIAALNANCDYFYRPEVKLPQIPTAKYKEWREAGNAGMFTIGEMYDAHCRELKLSPLLEGAIKWYTTRFVSEIHEVISSVRPDGDCWGNDCLIYIDRDTLAKQLMDGVVVLPMLEFTDYSYVNGADTIDELREDMANTPFGFLVQDDMSVMYESAALYILDNDDQDSDERPGVELFALNVDVIAQLKNI